jgi:hypothetical protein
MPVFILGPVQLLVSTQPRLNSEPLPAGSLLRLARFSSAWTEGFDSSGPHSCNAALHSRVPKRLTTRRVMPVKATSSAAGHDHAAS